MLSLNFIQENKNFIIERLKIRNINCESIISEIIELNILRKKIQLDINNAQSEYKKLSTKTGFLYQQGKKKEAEELKKHSINIKENINVKQKEHQKVLDKLNALLCDIPNIPHSSVHFGENEEDNEIIKENGIIPNFNFDSLPHWELVKKFNIIDFDLGNKISGSGFPLFKGKGAKLSRALINFFLNENIKKGYNEVAPPLLVNEDSAFGTGQLPDKDGQMYHISEDNLYLIPTAEIPVTNIFRNTILPKGKLPQKFTAYTPCFRREAGSYGKNVRGLNRIHQFDKVEIVQITLPENSYKVLDEMVLHVEKIIQKLELPYRIVKLCGIDLGFSSALTYDFEVYSAAQKKWLEVSSVSNFESFQSNRLKLRYKDDKQTKFAHTLNGSALALPRIIAALLENNQTQNSIKIPKVLRDFTQFDVIS